MMRNDAVGLWKTVEGCAKKLSGIGGKTSRGTCRRSDSRPSEALAGWHAGQPGVVHVDEAPAAQHLAVDLGFAAVRGDGPSVVSEFGGEIPVKLGPGGVSENMNCDVARRQLSFGKSFSHQTLVDVSLDLLETVFVAERMDEGNFRRVPPNLGCQRRVRIIHRLRVLGDDVSDRVDLRRGLAGRRGGPCFRRWGSFFRREWESNCGGEREEN